MKSSYGKEAVIVVVCVLVCLNSYRCGAAVPDCDVANKTGLPSDVCTFDLKMKGAWPHKADEYFCAGYEVENEIFGGSDQDADGYIVRYEALADASTAHHILVFGCRSLRRDTSKVWHCGQVCDGEDQIIFAWAKNAPPLSLPKGVGQHIGKTTDIKYIVIQIHYAQPLKGKDSSGIRLYTTRQRQPYISGIYLLLAYDVTIPRNTPKFHVDSSCRFNWDDSIVPFGYRTHAHSLCRVISGYKVKDREYEMIGKGNPQWPQAFYPVKNHVVINPGDILAARCTYNSTGRYRATEIGSTANDEMCNFYIMYYMNSSMENKRGQDTCYQNKQQQVFRNIPAGSDVPLPPNPALEGEAMSHHHHHGMGGSNDEDLDHGKIDEPQVDNERPQVDFHGNVPDTENPEVKLNKDLELEFVSEVGNLEIGQVGGLAVNRAGDLYIFHRGSVIWNQLSFTPLNVYTQQNLPVEVDPVIVLDKDGTLKKHFGKNRFYLPHGLSLDSEENIWLTDVALHQVFRIPRGEETPDMTLGIQFEPGTDTEHFCKPSDVAVLSTGEFFVSDGYCNSRIMKFDKNGYFLKQWGSESAHYGSDSFPAPGTFNLPHGVALAEEKGLLCVADRENGRIQCFDLEGNFVRQMHPKTFGQSLYSLEYCPNHGGVLFAVNGPLFGSHSEKTQGFTLDINTGTLVSLWNIPGEGLTHPHDVTVDSTNHVVYVGELNPRKVWKFQMSKKMYLDSTDSTKLAGKQPAVVTGTSKQVSKETSTISVVMATSAASYSTSVVKSGFDSVVNSDTGLAKTVSSTPLYSTEVASSENHAVSTQSNEHRVNVDVFNIEVRPPALNIKKEESDGFGPSVIIGTLLVVPVLLLVIITVIYRLYHTGRFKNCRRRSGKKSVFSLGNFLHSHKGFDRLSTEDDDHDYDNVLDDDSDNEEFNIVRKA
ncbi:peptidyl-glycine alpha-amidating monooxygenase-like isoform X2 [Mercenaria mercenaria]|uniref:peptidyl-glycine alpha-amidating monooxygenase-like isoform X2 n=1 Tax=Mercenaria mercenaria TaxID=6596 RepID=UPI00234E376C|nr:peptidyl-glycine alpha-amidating monooxygenase-like isoform X2 [Mercenaria mercenaria]